MYEILEVSLADTQRLYKYKLKDSCGGPKKLDNRLSSELT